MRAVRIQGRPASLLRPRTPGRVVAAAVLALLSTAAGGARADASAVTVLLDRAQVLPFPPSTETVVVGNPIIADVTMLRNSGEVILTGKGFGDTNLLFLDAHGAVLADTNLRVREAPATMVVQRGAARETYACHPRCEPTISLGDGSEFLARAAADVGLRNSIATGAAARAAAH